MSDQGIYGGVDWCPVCEQSVPVWMRLTCWRSSGCIFKLISEGTRDPQYQSGIPGAWLKSAGGRMD